MSLSRDFAAFVANLRYDDLPPAVADRARGVTLQALSSALVAHDMPASRQALGPGTRNRTMNLEPKHEPMNRMNLMNRRDSRT